MGRDIQMHDGETETIFELIKEIMDTRLKPLPRQIIGFKVRGNKNT